MCWLWAQRWRTRSRRSFSASGSNRLRRNASMHLSLITHAIHKRVWVFGAVLMVGSFGLQATALAHGRLSIVQPVLTLELPILVLILFVWFGQRIGWHEIVGAIAAAGGLAAFLTSPTRPGGDEVPNVGQLGARVDCR